MATKKEEEKKGVLQTISHSNLPVPAFMQEDEGLGTEVLSQFVRPPYVKIIKSQAKSELKEKWGEGSAVLFPSEIVLCKKQDEGFLMVPLFFYVEYCVMNPIQVKTLSMMRDRTFDPTSEIAKRARDPKAWTMPCPENKEFKIKYVEMLNFIFTPFQDGLPQMPCIMSFSRGEHRTGRMLSSMIQAKKASICGQVYRAKIGMHKYAQGEYEGWGFDFETPEPAFVTDPATYASFKDTHLMLKKKHEDGLIRADYDEDTAEEAATAPSASSEF